MDNVVKEIPNFVKNQLLTADMLNALVRFAEDQAREIKSDFIGNGVVHGLDVSAREKGGQIVVVLEKGEGLTTDGQTIKLKNDETYTGYFKLNEKQQEGLLQRIGVAPKREQLELWELTDEAGANPFAASSKESAAGEGASPMDIFKGKNLVLVLDEEVVENRKPIHRLSEASAKRQVLVRKFLIPSGLLPSDDEAPVAAKVNPSRDLQPITLPRYGWKNGRMQLDQIQSFEEFHFFYQDMIGDFCRQLTERLREMHARVGGAVGNSEANPFKGFNEAVLIELERGGFPDFQYLYDYLEDLALAYNELQQMNVDIALEADTPPVKKRRAVGQFLNLGAVLDESGAQGGRQHFQPSTNRQPAPKVSLSKLKQGYRRILVMAQLTENRLAHFQSPAASDSGKSAQDIQLAFGSSSLPLYIKNENGALSGIWGQGAEASQNSSNSEELLAVKPDVNNCYRVEGHLGLPLKDVMNALVAKRQVFSLPFQIAAVQLDKEEQSGSSFFSRFMVWAKTQNAKDKRLPHFPSFAQRYAGMQHGKGVPVGGTLIVVATKGGNLQKFSSFSSELNQEEWYVVGDFFVPYQVGQAEVWEGFDFSGNAKPFIQIAKRHFTADDPNRYELSLFPQGGQLRASSSLVMAEGTHFYIQPSVVQSGGEAPENKHILSYTVEGKETRIEVTVR